MLYCNCVVVILSQPCPLSAEEGWMKPESMFNHLYCPNLKEGLGLGIHREPQVFCLEVTDIWMDKRQLREKLEITTETAHKLTYAFGQRHDSVCCRHLQSGINNARPRLLLGQACHRNRTETLSHCEVNGFANL